MILKLKRAILGGRIKTIQKLINLGLQINSVKFDGGKTPLMLAFQTANLEVINFLIANGGNLNARDEKNDSVFDYATLKIAHNPKLVGCLFSKGLRFEDELLNLAYQGDVDKFKEVYEKQASNPISFSGYSVIHYAAANGHLALCEYLLQKDKDLIKAKNKKDVTPLLIAAANNQLEVVKLFLQKDTVLTEKNIATLSLTAASNGHLSILLWLFEQKRFFSTDKHKNEVLFAAVGGGHRDIILWLKKQNVDLSITNNLGQNILLIATAKGQLDIIKWILIEGAVIGINLTNKDTLGQTPFLVAVAYDQFEVAQWYLKRGASLDERDKHQRTAILIAASHGYLHMLKWLLSCGASLASSNDIGNNALFIAAKNNELEAVHYLLEKGADISGLNSAKETLFDVCEKDSALFLYLKLYKVLFEAKNALLDDCPELVVCLKYDGVDSAVLKEYVIHCLIRFNQIKLIPFCLNQNNFPYCNKENFQENTLLHTAIASGRIDAFKLLLDYSINLHFSNSDKNTVWHLAASQKSPEYFSLLLNKQYERDKQKIPLYLNIPDANGKTPLALLMLYQHNLTNINLGVETLLHVLAGYGQVSLLEAFFEDNHGGLNAPSPEGYTPLWEAIKNKNLPVATFLIKKGANIDICLSIASKLENNFIFKVLGDLSKAEENHALASKCYEKIILEGEENINLLLEKAAVLYKADNLIEAFRYYNGVLKFVSECVPALNGVARIYIKQGKYKKAIEILNTAFAISSNNIETLRLINRTLIKTQQYELLVNYNQRAFDVLFKQDKKEKQKNVKDQSLPLHDFITEVVKTKEFDDQKVLSQLKSILEAGSDIRSVDKKGNTILHLAVKKGHLNLVKMLCNPQHKLNVSVENVDLEGETVLHKAAFTGGIELFKELLIYYPHINVKSKRAGRTPLLIAAANGHKDLCEYMLSKKADPNLADAFGNTCLQQAVINKSVEFITLFLSSGSKLSTKNTYHQTALHIAVYNDSEVMIKALLEIENKSSDSQDAVLALRQTDENHCTPLALAVKGNNMAIAKLLVDAGSPVDISMLCQAAMMGNNQLLSLLLAKGSLELVLGQFQDSPLYAAIRGNHLSTFQYLINYLKHNNAIEKLINLQDPIRNSLWHAAAMFDAKILNYLLQISKEVLLPNMLNLRNDKSQAPLHVAIYCAQEECAINLIRAGAKLDVKDNFHATPLDLAKANNNNYLIKIIEEELWRRFCRNCIHMFKSYLAEKKLFGFFSSAKEVILSKELEVFLNENITIQAQVKQGIEDEQEFIRNLILPLIEKISEENIRNPAFRNELEKPDGDKENIQVALKQVVSKQITTLKFSVKTITSKSDNNLKFFKPEKTDKRKAFCDALEDALHNYYGVCRALYEDEVTRKRDVVDKVSDAVQVLAPGVAGVGGLVPGLILMGGVAATKLLQYVRDEKTRYESARFVEAFGKASPGAVTKGEKDIPIDRAKLKLVAKQLYLRYQDQIEQCTLSKEGGIRVNLAKTDGIAVLANCMADRIFKHILNGGSKDTAQSKSIIEKAGNWFSSFTDPADVYEETRNFPIHIRCIYALLKETEGKDYEIETETSLRDGAKQKWQAGSLLVKTGLKTFKDPEKLYIRGNIDIADTKKTSKPKEDSLYEEYGFCYVDEAEVKEREGFRAASSTVRDPFAHIKQHYKLGQ